MISHITLGANNLEASEIFYSNILDKIFGAQIYKSDVVAFFGFGEGSSTFSITVPFDGESLLMGMKQWLRLA